MIQILISPWCVPKALNRRRIGKIMWITRNKFPFSREIAPLLILEEFIMLRTSHRCHSIIVRASMKPFVWRDLNYAIRGTQQNILLSTLFNCLRWFQNFSSTLQEYIFLWIITTTLQPLMPKLWNQNTVQSLMSMLPSFVRHKN